MNTGPKILVLGRIVDRIALFNVPNGAIIDSQVQKHYINL